MLAVLTQSFLAAVTHGAVVVPLLWVIGVILVIAGVVTLFRGGILAGVVLLVLGIFLGGLNVL